MSRDKTTKRNFDLSRVVNKEKIKIKQKNTPTLLTKEQLEEIESRRNKELVFSWRFFDRFNEMFNMGNTERSWFISLLDAFKSLSSMTVMEFRQQASRRGLRVHSHNWKKATAKFNFPESFFEQHQDDCLQFSISKANGRVHGFLIDNIFYIVWLDPDHNLYPTRESNWKVIEHEFPVTDYEILQYKYEKLKEENEKLKEDLKTCELLLDEC